MKNIKFYTLHLDNNFRKIENIYYFHYIDKGINVDFQLTKTLKMNIRKNSTKKDRTNDSFNIWIRQHFTIASLFLSSWAKWSIPDFIHHITIINFKHWNSYQFCLVRHWTMAVNMFSILQNLEYELSGTLNTNIHSWLFHKNFD